MVLKPSINDTFLCERNPADTVLILAGLEVFQRARSCLSYVLSKEEEETCYTEPDPPGRAPHEGCYALFARHGLAVSAGRAHPQAMLGLP